ncbi:VanZ family protein [Streptomyces mirabilis]|uniref:VanZ family protein n=1 Tax=Streptomyces mirabilis TaxID=68239 RepID=UPI003437F49B
MALEQRCVGQNLVLTATVMLLVALVQATVINGRAFDVDDAILNTSGPLVGYVCCCADGWAWRCAPAVESATGTTPRKPEPNPKCWSGPKY